MTHYQVWFGTERVGDPLPGPEAAQVFTDQLELIEDDSDDELFVLPAGYQPPQDRDGGPDGW